MENQTLERQKHATVGVAGWTTHVNISGVFL
jgi:hypothetical protein